MKLLHSLTPDLTTWALAQPLFFVASAPTHGRHVNVSPKGLPASTLAVLGPNAVAYLDRTGSGCETIAHLYENGRATLMFCSFGPSPRILRLFCTGRVVEWDHPAFPAWLDRMGRPRPDAARAAIVLDVFAVTTSCGYGVPRVRKELWDAEAAAAKQSKGGESSSSRAEKGPGDDGIDNSDKKKVEEEDDDDGLTSKEKAMRLFGRTAFPDEGAVFEDRPTIIERGLFREQRGNTLEYQVQVNLDSLDGLPGLRAARRRAGRSLWRQDALARARRIFGSEREALLVGFLLACLLHSLVAALVSSALSPSSYLSRYLPTHDMAGALEHKLEHMARSAEQFLQRVEERLSQIH